MEKHKYTDEEIQKMKEMAMAGKTGKEIAEKLGLDVSSLSVKLSRLRKEWGIPKRSNTQKTNNNESFTEGKNPETVVVSDPGNKDSDIKRSFVDSGNASPLQVAMQLQQVLDHAGFNTVTLKVITEDTMDYIQLECER